MVQTLAARQNAGSQVAAVLNPVRGLRDQQRRAGVQPVDHARRNLMAIKETQRKLQEERESRSKIVPREPFKLKKFQGVSSRVATQMTSPRPDHRDEDEQSASTAKHKFLRKGERCNAKEKLTPKKQAVGGSGSNQGETTEEPVRHRIHQKTKPQVPKPNELNALAPRSNKNFIKVNTREVLSRDAQNREKASLKKAEAPRKHSNFGQVPEYIVQRQTELLAAKAQAAATRDPDCPPGMVQVSEAERTQTLDSLKQAAQATRNELRKFPLSLSSVAQRNRKLDLENQLEEEETAIAVFSKPKVYVYE
mmetsp:Transcript_2801/g.5412  ORF Transcript_2801/g.5412 Transcript_2801/m.5412 type:complete len:307 (+) Transcript_2801:163-1083(+)